MTSAGSAFVTPVGSAFLTPVGVIVTRLHTLDTCGDHILIYKKCRDLFLIILRDHIFVYIKVKII